MNKLKTYIALTCTLPGALAYGQTVKTDSLAQPRSDSLYRTLGTVTISASKPVIQHKPDRTVFNVENSVSAAGSDAYDLLRKTPGVQVTAGNISIAGKDRVSIMVNERLIQVSGEELEAMLRSMASEHISKIEVITTPPAKYDAAGNSGIINIVTKKMIKQGWNGSLSGTYSQGIRPRGMASCGINYRSSKWFLYGTAVAREFIYTMFIDNITYYTQQKQEEHLVQINHGAYNNAELGVDYNISPSATIGVSANYRHRKREVTQDYKTDVLNSSELQKDSVLYTYAREPFDRHYLTANIDYDWKIDTAGRRLKLSMNYFFDNNDIERAFYTKHTTSVGYPTGYESYNYLAAKQALSIKAITADWDLYKKWADVSIGAKASFISNDKDYLINTSKTDRVTYVEHTQAAYVSGAREWGKWQAKLGMRAEYTQTTVVSSATAETYKNSYCKIFPSGYLQYEVNRSLKLNINYSRRIERPDFEYLSPFRGYTTDVSYYRGNPLLQPYTSDNLEFGGTIKSIYYFRLHASHKRDFFTQISVVDSVQKAYYFTMVNTGDSWNYGMLLNTVLHIGKALQIMPQINGYYNNISSDYYNKTERIGTPSFSIEVNNTIVLNKSRTLTAELGARYHSALLRDVNLQYDYSSIWGGIKLTMRDNQVIAGIGFDDPLNTDYRRSENLYNNAYSSRYLDRREFQISLSWKFGNKTIKKTEKTNKISSETNRAG